VILDTVLLGDLADLVPSAMASARDLDERQVPTRVPTVVVWNVFTGIGNAYPDRAEGLRAVYERLLASRSTLDLNPRTARRGGVLNGEFVRSDTDAELDDVDSIVAAHGLLLDEPVVSNDAGFEDVDRLDVVTY
jgi:tRNA(fMet)-specific endonuclease VapC